MTQQQKAALLRLCRQTVEATVRGLPAPVPAECISHIDHGGAFVTLRLQRSLRGCMGTFSPEPDITATVQQAATSAAGDPRFKSCPIKPDELEELQIEVSILSSLQETQDPLSLEVGTHGIVVETRRGRGCFLPQVATEQGWTAEQFLSHCSADKAQAGPDAWREDSNRVLLFTSEHFKEPLCG